LRSLSVLFGVLTVPLIYAVARQLFRSRLAGLLAALLVVVSPLHIWYSQEVRMYTLLTFLCLLSSYLLLLVMQLTHRPEKQWQTLALWGAYTLTSIAAVYTHYFAFFVLAFHGLCLFLVWWEQGLRPKRLILGGVVSGLATLLAYLPWLPHLLTRYGIDVSYWPGRLKLPETLLDIALSFAGGESVSESIGLVLLIGYGLTFLLCLLALALQVIDSKARAGSSPQYPVPNRLYSLAFLLLYLSIPPALILILSYNSPKFNARYAMVSHPALLLITGGGLAALWEQRNGRLGTLLRRALAIVSIAFLLGVSAYADYNAYADPAFARADFRGVARYLRNHVAPGEAIILTSGHMFPVFDYYAPGVKRYLLPDTPTLDTTSTLDYAIAAQLNDWLAGRAGVWVVRWQDEVVDPAGYLAAMLAEVGEEQPADKTFPKVDLEHYRLPAGASFSDQPAIAHPADFNFADQLRLLGYTQSGEQQVTLFWQALEPLEEDYRISLTLRDTAGQSWGQGDGRPTAYHYPTDRWRVGQIVFGRYDLTPLPGTPPGDYGLEVGVYTEADPVGLDLLDLAGAPQGKRVMLGGVTLSTEATAPDRVQVPHASDASLGDGLQLLGWDLDHNEAQPGDPLLVTLIWSVESQPQDDYRLRVLITDANGQTLDAGSFPPTNIWHPTSNWREGEAWRGQMTFRLPVQAQAGGARLGLQLVDSTGLSLGPVVELTTIQVLSTDRVFTPPHPQVTRPANFGEKIGLVGIDLDSAAISSGDTLPLVLHWQALAEMDIAYTVFVHLLGPDGRVVSGHDGEPVDGARPTTGWVPGEFVADPHELSMPAELAPGEYGLELGLYDAGVPGMPRLPVLDSQGRVEADHVILGPVEVR
jgi:hypothetical protein